jgi:voltage-gated potassium channel
LIDHSWIGTTTRHMVVLIVLLVCLVILGTVGYMAVESFSLLDALYMTVITLTTVGYGEVHPLSSHGRIFTILLITLGAGFVAYNLAYFTQLMMDGDLLEMYRRRKLSKKVRALQDHYIICGYGQMGQIIVQQLMDHEVPVIVVDSSEPVVSRLREKGILYIEGDATEEEHLITAGIHQARGLVAVVNRDTDNVFIVLTARDLNKGLFICARASSSGTEKKLLKAGADRVVSPYASGALRIAHNILRPTVTDFMELALSGEGMELSMEEFAIPAESELVGKEIIHSGIRHGYNLIIVAIKRLDGAMVYNPAPHVDLQAGDILVAIGPRENLEQFALKLYGRRCPVHTQCNVVPLVPVDNE